ncbi:MAG: hypothetical protein BVN32_01595 [Proteobacteria bacterium ST_bin14]|nr:MAG: hypothetical protein BVN32_01595 [Proteobacteria bacterium ST_bin14]
MVKIDDHDLHGGRAVIHYGGDGTQTPPRSDNRQRVNDAVLFYVVQVCGSFVNVSESAQRVLFRVNRTSYVTFEREKHQLRPATQFKATIQQYTRHDCPVYMAGFDLTAKRLQTIEPWPFIYIVPTIAWQAFQALYVEKNEAKYRALLGR